MAASTGEMDKAMRERLSAIADGEADEAAVRQACGEWRDQPAVATAWRDYHLIGDVMRSDDLASDAGHDAAFLDAFRARLAQEPVVIAPSRDPAPLDGEAAPPSSRRVWLASSAVAAGFLAVAGVLVVTRAPEIGPSPATQIAAADGGPIVRASASGAMPAPDMQPLVVANGKLIRDARLDNYLKAHKQFSGTSALGAPSAFLRSATSDASNR